MMKAKYLLFVCLSATILSQTVSPVPAAPPVSKRFYKNPAQENEVKNFNGVATGGPLHVTITLGNTESLRFEGDAEAIATLVTEVKGNILIIRPKTSWTSWARKYQDKKINVYVSAKNIKSLTMSGNGSITVNGKIKAPSLAATISGSGNVYADADVNNFTGTISGSGNLNISGSASQANIVVSGSGAFTKKTFTVGRLTSVISGSGAVNVTAKDHIETVISGSGVLNHSGNASVEKRISGSGSVRKI